MNKINYPTQASFHSDYLKIFTSNFKKKIDGELIKSGITFNHTPITCDILFTMSLKELINIKPQLVNYSKSQYYYTSKRVKNRKIKGNKFNDLFNYKTLQPKLANFFMNNLKLKTCHYCSLDLINSFKDFPDFEDGLDLANTAEIDDLLYINGIDEKIARQIISKRNKNIFTNYSEIPVSKEIQTRFENLPLNNTHNHFTLDHLLPQVEYKYLSLCLYNLVPSCYSCNSKFKKENVLIENSLQFISPTSSTFSLNEEFEFKIFFNGKFEDVKSENDFELRKVFLKNEIEIAHYFKLFKIIGRYSAHKDIILELVQKKQKYSDTKIEELSKTSGLSQKEIRKMIFGDDLFNADKNGNSFVKFRRDIAKDIKIKDIIK